MFLRLKHSPLRQKKPPPRFSEAAAQDAAAMINAAKRPVLIWRRCDQCATARVRELAEKAQLLTTHDFNGAGMLPWRIRCRWVCQMYGAQHQLYFAGGGFVDSARARFDDRAIGKTEQFVRMPKLSMSISIAQSWAKSSSRMWRFRRMLMTCWRN